METPDPAVTDKIKQLFQTPKASVEGHFSPYFYQYFSRFFRDFRKFDGYLDVCKHLFSITKAKDASLLDLGCGFGLMATLLGLYGAKEVIGYDLNTEKIDLLKKLLSYLGPEVKNIKPVLGDSSKIGYPDEYFDVVVANETLSHVREIGNSINEVYRVLKPEGRFLIRDGNNSLFLLGRIRRRRFWKRIEYGPVDSSWFRSTDIPLPYFEVRRKMISEKFPQLELKKLDLLSEKTAGLSGNEIFNAIEEFKKLGKIPQRPRFRYRNPITGEFPEKEINPLELKATLTRKGFEVSFVPYFYSESFGDKEMIIKRFYYLLGKYVSTWNLFLTPGFAVLGVKGRGVKASNNCHLIVKK